MASRDARSNGGRGGTSGPDEIALEQHFDRDDLYALRAAVAAHAAHLGAPPERVAHVVIVASELASNAVRHGGGGGRLRLWRTDGRVCCEVRDAGPGLADPRAGTVPPSTRTAGGRGLWIVRRLASDVWIESGGYGTQVTAVLPLDPA